MAEVKFSKGSEEWMMFMDFWNLCQKYWNVENNNDYWKNLMSDCNDFKKKYDGIPESRYFALAFMESLEEKRKAIRE